MNSHTGNRNKCNGQQHKELANLSRRLRQLKRRAFLKHVNDQQGDDQTTDHDSTLDSFRDLILSATATDQYQAPSQHNRRHSFNRLSFSNTSKSSIMSNDDTNSEDCHHSFNRLSFSSMSKSSFMSSDDMDGEDTL